MDVLMQGIRAAEAVANAADAMANVEALKLQMAKRKLQASSNGSNVSRASQRNSDKHADKYHRSYRSPEVGAGMADERRVDQRPMRG